MAGEHEESGENVCGVKLIRIIEDANKITYKLVVYKKHE